MSTVSTKGPELSAFSCPISGASRSNVSKSSVYLIFGITISVATKSPMTLANPKTKPSAPNIFRWSLMGWSGRGARETSSTEPGTSKRLSSCTCSTALCVSSSNSRSIKDSFSSVRRRIVFACSCLASCSSFCFCGSILSSFSFSSPTRPCR